MHMVVSPLFGKAKVKLTQTPRAVTPFGGLASFLSFLQQRGLVQQVQTHLPWQLVSPNAIPLAHTLTAFVIGVITGARRFADLPSAARDYLASVWSVRPDSALCLLPAAISVR